MRSTKIGLAALAALAGASTGLAQEGATEEPKPVLERPLDLSGFKINAPAAAPSIAGTYRLRSPFGGEPRGLVIRESDGGFWKYEGALGEGGGRALLKLDPAPAPAAFRGKLDPALDACLGEDAHVERVAITDAGLSLDVALRSIPRPGSGMSRRCSSALSFEIASSGADRVRLRPIHELRATRGADERPRPPGADEPFNPEPLVGSTDEPPRSSGSYSLDAPRIAVGTAVAVTSAMTDDRQRTWLRVEALGGAQGEDDPPSGWVREVEVVGRVRYVLERVAR